MKIWHEVWEYVKMILLVIVVVFVVDYVILINAQIPSQSMETTVMKGDRLFGNRLAYGFNLRIFGNDVFSKKWKDPERFDVIIFRYPDDESQLFIKRLIGLPGETLEVRDGKVYINGSEEPLDDSFVPETPTGDFGPIEIPENSYFMMGDNREHSNDSRAWEDPFVEFHQIVGKAWFRYWPLTEISLIK